MKAAFPKSPTPPPNTGFQALLNRGSYFNGIILFRGCVKPLPLVERLQTFPRSFPYVIAVPDLAAFESLEVEIESTDFKTRSYGFSCCQVDTTRL